jgi:ABC-type nickel/cobalt efflux system permease component RcnA
MHSHHHEVTLGLAFALGALHAVEPGHGKTAMLVYLSGGRRNFWHPIVIGVSSGLAHSISLLAIALVIHVAQHWIVGDHDHENETVTHALQWVSGALVLAVGIWMWISAAKKRGPQCGCHGHHKCEEKSDKGTTSYSMSALLGIAFGLLPCPSALAAYFASISTGSPIAAYAVIGLFAAGIACSLSAIGIVLQWIGTKPFTGTSRLRTLPWPYIRAGLILGIGCVYLGRLIAS